MSDIKTLLLIWIKPRTAVSQLLVKQTSFKRICFVIFLTITYFFLLVLLLLLIHKETDPPFLMSWTMFEAITAVFFIVAIGIGVLLTSISLFFYLFAVLLGGRGSLSDTKSIVFSISTITIPMSVFLILGLIGSMINISAIEQGLSKPLYSENLQLVSIFFLLFFFIYAVIILMKMLSEVHKISIWRAFPLIMFSLIITPPIVIKIISSFLM